MGPTAPGTLPPCVTMSGNSWIRRTPDNPDAVALASGLRDNGYSANDFQVIAMVGEVDGTNTVGCPLPLDD